MFAFLLTLVQFLRVLARLLRDRQIRAGLILLGLELILGSIFYHNIEGWSFVDSLYFCVITLATIGYGDFAPQTALGKLFTIIYIFIAMGLLVGILNLVTTKGRERDKQDLVP